jgi:hypothetical protein
MRPARSHDIIIKSHLVVSAEERVLAPPVPVTSLIAFYRAVGSVQAAAGRDQRFRRLGARTPDHVVAAAHRDAIR